MSSCAGSSLVVVSHLITASAQENLSRPAAQWTADRAPAPLARRLQRHLSGRTTPHAVDPVAADDTLVASNGNLARFDGTMWVVSTKLNPACLTRISSPSAPCAFGPDYALQVIAPTTVPARPSPSNGL